MRDVGARKFVVFGVGPIGCTPNAIANHGSCIEEQNDAAFIFGTKLKSLVDQLNSQFTDSKFLFRNISSDPFDTSHGKHLFYFIFLVFYFIFSIFNL